MASASAPRSSASRISISGTSVTSAPRRSSSSASDFASGRVTTMRRPASGWSATNRRKYAVCAGSECVLREPLAELVGLSFSLHANHQTSIDRCDEPLETHTRGRRGSPASRDRAAQPAQGRAGTRSAVVSARAAGSSSATSRARMASSSTRHWIASAPWPGAGSVSGASHPSPRAPGRADECPRRRAQPHRTRPRRPSDPRVDVSPGSSGSRDHREVPSWAARGTARPTTAPSGRSASCRRAQSGNPARPRAVSPRRRRRRPRPRSASP